MVSNSPKDIQKDKVDDSIEDINEEAKDADDHGWQQQSLVVLHETIEDESEGDNVDQTPDDSPDKTTWCPIMNIYSCNL